MKSKLLKEHGEDWKVIPKHLTLDDDVEDPNISQLSMSIKVKDERPDDYKYNTSDTKPRTADNDEKPVKVSKKTKRKAARAEKDPNAPKRPSNPFFQFCQEQRQILMEQINSELKPGEAEPTKQELTRQLAIKWKSLTANDKQVRFSL